MGCSATIPVSIHSVTTTSFKRAQSLPPCEMHQGVQHTLTFPWIWTTLLRKASAHTKHRASHNPTRDSTHGEACVRGCFPAAIAASSPQQCVTQKMPTQRSSQHTTHHTTHTPTPPQKPFSPLVAGGSEGKLSGSVRSYNHLVKRSNQVRGSQTM